MRRSRENIFWRLRARNVVARRTMARRIPKDANVASLGIIVML